MISLITAAKTLKAVPVGKDGETQRTQKQSIYITRPEYFLKIFRRVSDRCSAILIVARLYNFHFKGWMTVF